MEPPDEALVVARRLLQVVEQWCPGGAPAPMWDEGLPRQRSGLRSRSSHPDEVKPPDEALAVAGRLLQVVEHRRPGGAPAPMWDEGLPRQRSGLRSRSSHPDEVKPPDEALAVAGRLLQVVEQWCPGGATAPMWDEGLPRQRSGLRPRSSQW